MSFKKFLDMQLTTFNLHYIPIEIYILKLDLVWGFEFILIEGEKFVLCFN